MFDLNSLPVPGGIIVASMLWAGVSAFALGPLVASRTIESTGWLLSCEDDLREAISAQAPPPERHPGIRCEDAMDLLGNGTDQLCEQGLGTLFEFLTIDPLAAQREHARRLEAARIARIADLSPSRCSCAARVVGADRVTWGMYAGSARLINEPDNLQSDLMQALHSPACTLLGEG